MQLLTLNNYSYLHWTQRTSALAIMSQRTGREEGPLDSTFSSELLAIDRLWEMGNLSLAVSPLLRPLAFKFMIIWTALFNLSGSQNKVNSHESKKEICGEGYL